MLVDSAGVPGSLPPLRVLFLPGLESGVGGRKARFLRKVCPVQCLPLARRMDGPAMLPAPWLVQVAAQCNVVDFGVSVKPSLVFSPAHPHHIGRALLRQPSVGECGGSLVAAASWRRFVCPRPSPLSLPPSSTLPPPPHPAAWAS
jgi:hypothetical protein